MIKLLIITCVIFTKTLNYDLKAMVVFARHGSRNGLHIKNNPFILNGNGIRMNYILGDYMRQTYEGFFDKQFSLIDNQIISSDSTRNLVSTAAFFNGLYPLGSLDSNINVDPKFYNPPWD